MYIIQISQFFPKLYESSSGNVKVELNIPNYATQSDLKGITGVVASNHQWNKV